MIKHRIYEISKEEVCIPSTDYYARGGDWQRETITNLIYTGEFFDTYEACIDFLKSNNYKGEYVILPSVKF